MKTMTGKFLEECRVLFGPLASSKSDGFNGAFLVPLAGGSTVTVICSNGLGWEHVSVSLSDRCPTWDEMSEIKRLFWQPTECVMQLHPPETDYVNCHPNCLHLWRPTWTQIPRPPALLVGPSTRTVT